MPDPNFVIFYVNAPQVSARFYQDVLGKPPVESSETFVMFALDSGVMLGLWRKDGVLPPVSATGVGSELAFACADIAEVAALHQRWTDRGVPIAQSPTQMDFGFTFTALDPDGHRLRVFAPGAA